jgi:endonuclease/exonuclease/phosphatase family metal-dependent hydrolase
MSVVPGPKPGADGAPTRLRMVAYNFLAGGSAKRAGQWSRVVRALGADVVFGQECRPPDACPGERFRVGAGDALAWAAARPPRWGTGLFVRGARLRAISVPGFDGWVVGGEVTGYGWPARRLLAFSVHGPAGERGYVKTMHEIIDRLVRIRRDTDLVLGGDFNVVTGYRDERDPRTMSRGERELLDRMGAELDLLPAWQTANPGRRLAQTLRWVTNPTTPYHCDGVFIPRTWGTRLLSCRVVRGSRWDALSDHSPVVAEVLRP